MTYSYNYYDIQNKLKQNLDKVIRSFDLNLRKSNKMYVGSCPVHSGHKEDAFNLYYQGIWKCRTHQCHGTFKSNMFGLVRGLLSKQRKRWHEPGDRICSFGDTIEFIEKLINDKISKVDKEDIEKHSFIRDINVITNNGTGTNNYGTRQDIKSKLIIPSSYYVNRGYSNYILNRYDVGLCDTPNKSMYDRVVVPVYDNDYKYMIGCMGRSIYPQCQFCKCYHKTGNKCPDKDKRYLYGKWKNSAGFLTGNHLYNYWFAKDLLKKTNTAVLVESPGNVWRLEEANIKNSIAIFGANFQDAQKDILDKSGVLKIIVLTDNDEAGKICADNIYKLCWRDYEIIRPQLPEDINDIGNMKISEVKSFFKSIGYESLIWNNEY